MKNRWLDIDKEGLQKSLGQKNKVFLLTEMVSNAWDEELTEVDVSLTRPDENGFSWLRVTDNSPTGWADLSHSHTMFAESVKKGKSEKRGRFNPGEKDVLALAIEAKLTTVTGQVLFNEDGTRTEGTETREIGSEFAGRFHLNLEEYEHIVQQAKLLIPPKGIVTLFNGDEIPYRKPIGSFTETLPIPLADKEGVMRNTERKTKVNLYEKLPGEVAMIYEMGIPIVELGDDKWHVNVMQKVPLSRDRDNVNPAYLRKIRVGVLNAKFEELGKDDSTATWVKEAMGSPNSTDDAVKHVIKARFGAKAVIPDVNDVGSTKGGNVQRLRHHPWRCNVEGRVGKGQSRQEGRRGAAHSDDRTGRTNELQCRLDRCLTYIPAKEWTPPMQAHARTVENLAPKLIEQTCRHQLHQ